MENLNIHESGNRITKIPMYSLPVFSNYQFMVNIVSSVPHPIPPPQIILKLILVTYFISKHCSIYILGLFYITEVNI